MKQHIYRISDGKLEKQIKELIENLTSDGKEREALSRQWNSDKIDAEQREIKKWEKKFERLRSYPDYPDNPSFEEDENQRSAKKSPTASTHQNDGKRDPSKDALRKRQLAIGMPAVDQVQVVQRTMPTQFHQNKNQGMRVEKSRLINATTHRTWF